jgi:hypothetical protein
MKYATEMASAGTIGLGIQVILRPLPQQFERLVLVLLVINIYEIHGSDSLRWYDKHIYRSSLQYIQILKYQ